MSTQRFRTPSSRAWRRIARLAWLALVGTIAYPAVILGPPWFDALVPPSARLHAIVRLMQGAQTAYVVVLIALPPTLIVVVIGLWFAGRRERCRTWLVRTLAICASLAIGIALAEGISAVRLDAMGAPMPRIDARDPDPTPTARAREASPRTRFPDPPHDRTVDIVVLGGSSARGDPYHEWLSVGEIVAWKLHEAIPDRTFAVRNLARPGFALEQVHRSLEHLERRPDLVILYSGHNEFGMQRGWDYTVPYYIEEAPAGPATLAGLLRARSPLCRLIGETAALVGRACPPNPNIPRQLVNVPAHTAAEYVGRLRDFRARLEAITAYGERVGAVVVLVIPPGNDADYEPNRSFLSADTPRAAREAFARDFRAARQLEESDPDGAVAAYRALLERQPGFAEAHYRLARLDEAAGRRGAANRHYVAARDADGLPIRCMSELQDSYRAVAAAHPEAILIDGPAVLGGLSPRGIAGDAFFTDAMHPSLIRYTGLAQAILRALHRRRVFGWGAGPGAAEPAVTPAECARHFGIDRERWRKVCDYAAAFYHHAALVRFDPSERLVKQARYEEASRRIRAGLAPEEVGVPGVGTTIVVGPRRPAPAAEAVATTRDHNAVAARRSMDPPW